MAVSVAEYLGQRTDVAAPVILPAQPGAQCPFMNGICDKVKKGDKPVCSVRKANGDWWITCRHRLCASKKNVALTQYQTDILSEIAKTVFAPNITLGSVCVKREEAMPVCGSSTYHADYIMRVNGFTLPNSACPTNVVLEMQGGGETSSTGAITRHVDIWEASTTRTNALLGQSGLIANPIETNAWRRQQEQFLVKGNIAIQTGGAMVFCMGKLLFDYLHHRFSGVYLNNLRAHGWSLCLISVDEDKTVRSPGPIKLEIQHSKLLFTNYPTFVQVLTNQGQPCPDMFRGQFEVLGGGTVSLP